MIATVVKASRVEVFPAIRMLGKYYPYQQRDSNQHDLGQHCLANSVNAVILF
jgi:hypothetical protein